MYAYVINLARSRDRYAHMVSELEKTDLEYEFVAAVDGRELDISDPTLVSIDELSTRSVFPANSAASVLSHIRCYERIIAAGLDAALVLEDDAILPADINSLADSVAAQLTGAEVALLSFNSGEPLKISREGAVHVLGDRMLALPIDALQPASGAAYVITHEACERLIKFLPPIRTNADQFGLFYQEGAIDRLRCVVPLSVQNSAKFRSTQGSYSLGNGLRARLLWPIVMLELPVLHQILVHRRQRIQNQWSQWEMVDMPFIERPSRLD
jgi:glycosyl transferase, family 25